jgi:RNA 2',3'-cyclic 3'-phosphodiesterase
MPRLFFALWPGQGAREALARHAVRLAKAAGGRAVAAANLHLTLVFLGEVGPDKVASVHRAAEAIEARGFTLALDQLGGFRRSGVGWAGCRQPGRELLVLQSALSSALAAEGFLPEARPYAPHLTLVRRIAVAIAPEAIEPVTWEVTAFALVESGRKPGGYVTVAEWSLAEQTR